MSPAPGDRVVVRHLLQTGAATDVIGRLVDDGDPVIVERDGAEHVISRSAIIAIKTVPPRPVRASEIRSLDLARARGWWSVEREWIDGWLCRAAPGIAGHRANCATPLHPDATLARLDGPRAWFAARGLPLRLSLSDRLIRGAPELGHLTDVLTRPAIGGSDAGVDVESRPDSAWLAATAADESLVTAVDGAALFASIRHAGTTVAAGRLAVTADAAGNRWGGIASVAVAPDRRRRGLATRIMTVLSGVAAEAGADRLYLEVERENAAASALYRGLGFVAHHGYGYWTEP
ncbi:GCN5-related N-acetyltransferase OS=Tsukamurella paurometabola (strain ATCC 8368 / DSM / CCUG 35730 / CIP 100753 / JCM 10117 / KCTC 9821 / NBRC 16120 /NCIMB 702349 / NCTC 13040) OX=521096 GN=Tpau_3732 PE=4 SV=1 [Tsukamurella paurometabola]|uniref:GCN5-related N-acetyltransferase n=1 Tax=Tsukamurella paurometabola (strain ATCC 8368 / DSM 20162 / CCUG 35730 / CIP 100753 / JCM 10117 / KCTC 9821 / NBRC 16120 / NCIMB 702349 / NCTC 13040) TaxID=521096 RepID=D5UYK7_TSUPD|nr:GNAT family N-acetyltransferase [Tsukamurella paurometabola]ADG80310.1 GCN5-related N-acetyltransferase [Tsukamurella paurometabola DSM 20162]SUP39213.1 putative acetyltransferase [Tsukamurella paurometabola]